MNVRTLIEALEDLADEHGDETPVLVAIQPAWPLALTVHGVTDHTVTDDEEPVVWMVAEGHPDDRSPYAPAEVMEAAL